MRRTKILLALIAWGLAAQTADGPAFDVASLKRIPPDRMPHTGLKRQITPSGVSFHSATLGNLFEWAFGKTIYEVAGPNWLNWPTDAAYDLDAKVDTATSEEQLKRMLQALMRARFRLSYHVETRDTQIYTLVAAKGGPKLKRAAGEGEPSVKSAGMYATRYERCSMALLAFSLERPFQPRHVADETGLQGTFDFTLDLSSYILDAATGKPSMDSIGRVDEAGALIRALPQQLGLTLERRMVPMEILVIDHVEKDPVAN